MYNYNLTLNLYSKKIYVLIRDYLEVRGDKTLNVCLKKSNSELSDQFLKFFVRGLFDTDGSVDTYRITLKCISKNLIRQTSSILDKFGITNFVRLVRDKRANCRDCYEVKIKKDSMGKFLEIIGLSNPRKLKKLKMICDGRDSNPGSHLSLLRCGRVPR